VRREGVTTVVVQAGRVDHRMARGLALGSGPPVSAARAQGGATSAPALPCAPDDGGLTLPPGFCATVFADGVGHARHLVVSPQGVVYVNTWSGRY